MRRSVSFGHGWQEDDLHTLADSYGAKLSGLAADEAVAEGSVPSDA